MPNRILHPEWRAEMGPNKYPFADTATLSNKDGDFIPEDLFLDASLYVIGAGQRLYLSDISLDSEKCTLTISDDSRKPVATAEFDLLSPPTAVKVEDLYGRPAGLLVADSNNLKILQSWTAGLHVFEPAATQFSVRVTMPTPEIGLRGFVLEDGSIFTGDVWLVGENGIVLSSGEADVADFCGQPGGLYPYINVDVVGDPLYRRKQCGPLDLFTTPRFLKVLRIQRGCTDTDMVPDADGGIRLTVGSHLASDTVLRLRTTRDGLIIETVGKSIAG